jgi:acyl-coenzyme A thioesterase PaaI-like protein
MNYWPPFLGAGIRIREISDDFTWVRVEMELRFWNRNYVGTHFGGSLYSMVDPFYMLMLIESLGRDYIVWDQAASIRFLKPGRGRVSAEFRLSEQELDSIKNRVAEAGKTQAEFVVQVRDDSGTVISEISKTIYIRKKSRG